MLCKYTSHKTQGFTLIETIIGMVILSISFTIIFKLILPANEQSASQVQQIKAAELARSFMNEIISLPYDENSENDLRCGESGAGQCSDILGADGEATRGLFDDVDDYNGYNANGNIILDAAGSGLTGYQGYNANVTVVYDSNYDGTADTNIGDKSAKLITVTVTTSQGERFDFKTYRSNF